MLLTFFLSACSFFGTSIPDLAGELTTTAPEGVQTEDTTFRLPYSLTDTLDIYEVESRVNSDLMSLCYSGLVRVNSSWDAEGELAESYEQKGKSVTFTISDDAVFSDGTAVTAADCAYSYGLAQTGKRYSRFFENIASFSPSGEKRLRSRSHTRQDSMSTSARCRSSKAERARCSGARSARGNIKPKEPRKG